MLLRDYPIVNAIKVGRLFLKPGDVTETFTRSCRMVFIETSDHSLPLARRGSSTLIRYRGRNFVVATRHQFEISPGTELPEDKLHMIRISSGEGRLTNIPLQRCYFEETNPDEDYHDLLIFEAAENWKTRHQDEPFFYPLAPFSDRKREKSFMVGYPAMDGVMEEYLDDFHPDSAGTIHIKRVVSDCDLDEKFETHAGYFRRYVHVRERHVFDGYSGGAVFSLVGDLGDMEIVLDGIVVRGGRHHVHIVDADYLVKMLNGHNELIAGG
jgi:hypothetical protein